MRHDKDATQFDQINPLARHCLNPGRLLVMLRSDSFAALLQKFTGSYNTGRKASVGMWSRPRRAGSNFQKGSQQEQIRARVDSLPSADTQSLIDVRDKNLAIPQLSCLSRAQDGVDD